jgi:hypothetical protein
MEYELWRTQVTHLFDVSYAHQHAVLVLELCSVTEIDITVVQTRQTIHDDVFEHSPHAAEHRRKKKSTEINEEGQSAAGHTIPN